MLPAFNDRPSTSWIVGRCQGATAVLLWQSERLVCTVHCATSAAFSAATMPSCLGKSPVATVAVRGDVLKICVFVLL